MGSKWTVTAWVADDNARGGYIWQHVYNGESLVAAVRAARRAKRAAGYVKVEWR